MAKKIAAEKVEPEVIAKCDNLNEVTPNHDEVITSVAQSSSESVSIKSMTRLIRGQQVMLDSDLAFLYGVETRRLNEQVKRNIERFPSDFMFQLTKEEFDFLKSQFAMSNITDSQDIKNLKSQIAISKWGGTRKLPYAFTRNGVAMLSSVLRSQTAVGVNIKIMRAFAAIPQLVNNNAQMIQRIFNIEQHHLADLLGTDMPMYSKMELGARRVRRDQVPKLAELYKIDEKELMKLWLADGVYAILKEEDETLRLNAIDLAKEYFSVE